MAAAPIVLGTEKGRGAPPGTFAALIVSFHRSVEWAALAPHAQATYRRNLDRLRAAHVAKPARPMERRHVRQSSAEIGRKTPAQASRVLILLRLLRRHAIDIGLRNDDPTRDVRRLR